MKGKTPSKSTQQSIDRNSPVNLKNIPSSPTDCTCMCSSQDSAAHYQEYSSVLPSRQSPQDFPSGQSPHSLSRTHQCATNANTCPDHLASVSITFNGTNSLSLPCNSVCESCDMRMSLHHSECGVRTKCSSSS